ncbi:3-hydroxyacyl-CoA dehydrogenase family protein [Desulfallas sp. Bu1-1]|jgi:3-hydroxybutyryl-CoA dehydrogenase|uniref:3-hydroxyacyl-CoA dehydrogenase family protein n=1 Tax=Desulfallas sp. Bu1-1 TaxID=2787620 RepID=UPI00189DD1A9|nr:3-hydroxyacyl-CoA dehydrogenase family protein [Desulfallas sp. Bu1-1]MBF7083648.1 3-hydroxyacyl-CoA dehydrogenase family protein [Desulfallas sp. Bu1-1]
MATFEIKNICVVGAGNMGHQIALAAALAGYNVKCTDINQEILQKAENFADTYLPQRVAKGKLSEEDAKAARTRISFTGDLADAAKDADLVIEAVIEKLDLKRKIFADLDRICPEHAILATNSSYIVSSKIADVTKRPEKVCNMHFFNPALVMKLVEVVKGPHVSDETVETVVDACKKMGKIPVVLKKEIYGFLVNRIVSAIKNEALYIYDMGVATPEDIDTAVVHALGHPMGPFRLMDLTGIDLSYYISMERYQETGDPKYKPSPIIVEKFIKKEWGRKTGKGFYDYCK